MTNGIALPGNMQPRAQQNLQALHAAPVIRSQRQLGASGLPISAMEPSTATKVGQVMAGTGRGHLANVVV